MTAGYRIDWKKKGLELRGPIHLVPSRKKAAVVILGKKEIY